MYKTVYTVYDKKVASYGNLILASHVGEVSRSIERALGDSESALSKWPGEFQVVTLGTYNQATGEILSAPVEVVLEVAALVRPSAFKQMPQETEKGGAK